MDHTPDERLTFQRLDELEHAEVTLTPAANQHGGGSITPADPSPSYRGGSIIVGDGDELREMFAGINRDIRFAELKVKRQTPGASRTRIVASQRPRTRGRESHRGQAGHRRTTSSRAGPSSDSDSDGPGEAGPPPRRRVVVDSQYVVVGIVST